MALECLYFTSCIRIRGIARQPIKLRTRCGNRGSFVLVSSRVLESQRGQHFWLFLSLHRHLPPVGRIGLRCSCMCSSWAFFLLMRIRQKAVVVTSVSDIHLSSRLFYAAGFPLEGGILIALFVKNNLRVSVMFFFMRQFLWVSLWLFLMGRVDIVVFSPDAFSVDDALGWLGGLWELMMRLS